MEERHSWKHIVLSAAVFLLTATVVIVALVLLTGSDNTASGSASLAEEETGLAPSQAQATKEPLSHDELVARTLEAVREYFPDATTLNVSDPNMEAAGAGGNFGIKDASGTDLGFVWTDNQGAITQLLTFYDADSSFRTNVTLEQAEGIAQDFMEGKGMDTSRLVMTDAKTHKPSEFQEEHQLTYCSQINGIPVEGYGNCSFNICSNDGRIVFFAIHGPFVLPDFTPPETQITEEEAKALALEQLKKDLGGNYPGKDYEYVVSDEPPMLNEFAYVEWPGGGIVPVWRIIVARNIMYGSNGYRDWGGIYQVNAATGEAMEVAIF